MTMYPSRLLRRRWRRRSEGRSEWRDQWGEARVSGERGETSGEWLSEKRRRATGEGRISEGRHVRSEETFSALLTRRSSPDRPSRVARTFFGEPLTRRSYLSSPRTPYSADARK